MTHTTASTLSLAFALLAGLSAAAADAKPTVTLPGKDVAKRFLADIEPVNRDGTYTVIALKVAKEKKDAKAVPAGQLPRSILAREKGGSGEPITALILGAAPNAGDPVKGRALALITRTSGGKDETRLVLTAWGGPFTSCHSLEDIEAQAPGTLAQLKASFAPAKDATFATKGRREAQRFVGDAITDFMCAFIAEADKRPLDKDGNPQLYRWAGARNIGE